MAVGLLELADALERGELESEPKANITNEKARTPAKMREEATKLMEKVPGLRQKIAGKSIPLEVRGHHIPLFVVESLTFQ